MYYLYYKPEDSYFSASDLPKYNLQDYKIVSEEEFNAYLATLEQQEEQVFNDEDAVN